nr:MAG TPA: hypothetical protein [Caudoviricetes sp.]
MYSKKPLATVAVRLYSDISFLTSFSNSEAF